MPCFIIEDYPLYREALVHLVRCISPDTAVVELARLGDMPAAVRQHSSPCTVLLDMSLADTLGTSGIHEVRRNFPAAQVVALADAATPQAEQDALLAGACSVLFKQMPTHDLLARLRTLIAPAAATAAPDDDGALTPPQASGPDLRLSRRQQQLLTALAQGQRNREIAAQLGISEHTVKVHLWRLFRRLGVHSRTQAIHIARLHGLIW